MQTIIARTPTLKVAGAALDETVMNEIVYLEVRLSLHTSGSVVMRFADDDYELFDSGKFQMGQELQVLLPGRTNSRTSVFTGQITTVSIEHERGQGATPVMLVEARDGSHRLATASTFTTYLDQSLVDIVTVIANRHGLTPKIERTSAKFEYLLQAGTDHALLTHLARGIGYEWFTDGKELHFRPRTDTSGPTLKRSDRTLLRFSARYTGTHIPKELNVNGWDPDQKQGVTGGAGSVLNGGAKELGSTAPFVGEQYKKARAEFGTALAVGELGARSVKEAETLAKSLATEFVGDGLRVEGLATCNPDIKAGGLISVEEVGRKLKGSYYVTEVRHEFGPGQEILTSFVCGGHRVEEPTWSPRGDQGGTWATRGPVVGIVTNIEDPKKRGRVKVKFPSLGDSAESDWARVAAPGAGHQRGFDARPEVNDEVLVTFELGDPRFPIVLGGLWNGKDELPKKGLEDDGNVTSRIFKSRVGHMLEFSDGPSGTKGGDAKRHVTIITGDEKVKLVLSEKGVTIDAGSSNSLALKAGGASLTLTDKGDIVLDGEAFTVTAKKAAKIESKGAAVELKGATGAKIDGGTAFEAKGAQAKVEGSGMLTLKGGMVKIN